MGGGGRDIYVCVCVCVCLFMCVLMHDACGSQGSILDAFFSCSPPNYPPNSITGRAEKGRSQGSLASHPPCLPSPRLVSFYLFFKVPQKQHLRLSLGFRTHSQTGRHLF